MISEKDVKHIAKLARLELSDEEIRKFKKDLSDILDYVKKLKEVKTEKIRPTTHSLWIENVLREDKANHRSFEPADRLIEAVPEKKERYVKVKAVL